MPDGLTTALIGAVAGAALTFAVQWLAARRQRHYELGDRTRAERLETTANLPPALVEYRHTQITRRAHQLKTGSRSDQLDREARRARADAWAAVYRFELLVDDKVLRESAYRLMGDIKVFKTIDDLDRLDRAGEVVHQDIQTLVKLARTRLSFV